MKIPAIICIVLVLLAASIVPALSAGKIVLANDDWTLSHTGFDAPNDGGVFATNVAKFFTGGSGGSFLAYSNNFGLLGTELRDAMTSAGYSWTVSTIGALDLARLKSYDATFLSVRYSSGISASVLTEYVNDGGNVYLYAGDGAVGDGTPWNPFLANFGLKFGLSYNPLHESTPIASSHPLFAGVDHLYTYNGNDITDTDPLSDANQVLVYSGTHGVYGMYDGSLVPEPSGLFAMVGCLSAFTGIAVRRRRR